MAGFSNSYDFSVNNSIFYSIGRDLNITNIVTPTDQEFLRNVLTPVPRAGYDPGRSCMTGTRVQILDDINRWTTVASKGLLWIHGLAGSGKSSIASSVCQILADRNCLGGSFFCKRDDVNLHDPSRVMTTLCHSLAAVCSPYRGRVVEALRNDPSLGDAAIQLQFRNLLATPLTLLVSDGYMPQHSIVILVDALDECGTLETRVQLLNCLLELSMLAEWLKVIVTSRANVEILDFFEDANNLWVMKYDLGTASNTFDDIYLYTKTQMALIARRARNPAWMAPKNIEKLAVKASGLFVWAYTACLFISQGLDKNHRLQLILSEQSSDDALIQLDNLYIVALKESMLIGKDSDRIFQIVMGTIVAAIVPLSRSTLQALLEPFVNEDTLNIVIDSLLCVLYEDKDNTVRLCHPSFADFLGNPMRCPQRFCIEMQSLHTLLAHRCLDIMMKELKFNMCNLESSHYFNDQVIDLDSRVKSSISPRLSYSCIFWSSHLNAASSTVLSVLEKFLSGLSVLYWIEALSLLGNLRQGTISMAIVMKWVQDDKGIHAQFASEVYRFIDAFYEPISSSTPHLYVSALPMAPKFSMVSKYILPLFSNTVSWIQGQTQYWPNIIHRLKGHSQSVTATAISLDGQLIVSASSDANIYMWDAQTGKQLTSFLKKHNACINSICFSPDDKNIASGSADGTISIWNAMTGVHILCIHLEKHAYTQCVNSVAFSSNGENLVSGSADFAVCLWNAHSGILTHPPMKGHSGWVLSVTFSSDDYLIASGSVDKTICIWETSSGICLRKISGHTLAVNSLAFSPDGYYLASGSGDKTICLWNTSTGVQAMNSFKGHKNHIKTIAFSPDSQYIISGSDDSTVCIWSIKTQAMIASPLKGHTDGISSVQFFPDGQHILSSSKDKSIVIWDMQTLAPAENSLQGHLDEVFSISISPDSYYTASGSKDQTIGIWNIKNRNDIKAPLKGHTGTIFTVSFSPDGKLLASGSGDKTIRIWSVENDFQCINIFEHSSVVVSLAFSPSSNFIVSGFRKAILIWNVNTGQHVTKPLVGHSLSVSSVAFAPDGLHVASGSRDATICIWNINSETCILTLTGHVSFVLSMEFSPNGHYLVSASIPHTICVWDLTVGGIMKYKLEEHTSAVNSITISPDGQYIISGAHDQTIQIWDIQTGMCMIKPLLGHNNAVSSVAMSSDGQYIVSGSYDKSIRIWSPKTEMVLPNGIPVVMKDGWLCHDEDLILWIPPQHQAGLLNPRQISCIPSDALDHAVLLDYTKFVHGVSWIQVQN